jgi:hypothetical protein
MYMLSVVALISTGAFMSFDEAKVYNTLEACEANAQATSDALVIILNEQKLKIVNIGSKCVKIVPALEQNPYEKGA